jgi:hypothetical protein
MEPKFRDKSGFCEVWQDTVSQQQCNCYIPCTEHENCGGCGHDSGGECTMEQILSLQGSYGTGQTIPIPFPFYSLLIGGPAHNTCQKVDPNAHAYIWGREPSESILYESRMFQFRGARTVITLTIFVHQGYEITKEDIGLIKVFAKMWIQEVIDAA